MKFSIAVGIRYRHKNFVNSSFEELSRKGFSPLKDCHQLRRHDAKNVAYKGGARAIFCDVIGKGCKGNRGQREPLGSWSFHVKQHLGVFCGKTYMWIQTSKYFSGLDYCRRQLGNSLSLFLQHQTFSLLTRQQKVRCKSKWRVRSFGLLAVFNLPTRSQSQRLFDFQINLTTSLIFQTNPCIITRLALEKCEQDFEALYEDKVDGIMLPARARWHKHGEKNSKYFSVNLEKSRHVEKHVRKLHFF